MAIGDVVSDTFSLAVGASFDYQPAVGIEVMILNAGVDEFVGIAPVKVPNSQILLKGGVLPIVVWEPDNNPLTVFPLKMVITNSLYLMVFNLGAGINGGCFYGIQIK